MSSELMILSDQGITRLQMEKVEGKQTVTEVVSTLLRWYRKKSLCCAFLSMVVMLTHFNELVMMVPWSLEGSTLDTAKQVMLVQK